MLLFGGWDESVRWWIISGTATLIFNFVYYEKAKICWKEHPAGVKGTVESIVAGRPTRNTVSRCFERKREHTGLCLIMGLEAG